MVKYDKAGWVEDLPSLITGRKNHGCADYTDTSDQLVSRSPATPLSFLIATRVEHSRSEIHDECLYGIRIDPF